MFPRIKKIQSNGKAYEYLVISESVYRPGKGTSTKDIANLGNIKTFQEKDIANVIDGLVRLFKLEKYSLTDGVEIIESLEHGSIIFWQKIWDKLGLSHLIKKQIKLKNARVKLDVDKYIEIITVNRCVDPLSKLGVTRWVERTCYKEMKGYRDLPFDVTLFYRSMDHLLSVKDQVESEIYEKLKNLFSINVKMTFYDITSTYFYSESCPVSAHGYSRDGQPDKVQILVGVITSYEGYPIKHYVFEGNRKDETTVREVIKELKKKYNIEETTFVGDRGMITKLNLDKIVEKGYGYIMGVKTYQDEICQMLLSKNMLNENEFEDYKNLKIQEKNGIVKDFLKWKCKDILKRKDVSFNKEKLIILEEKIEKLTNKVKVNYSDYKKIGYPLKAGQRSNFKGLAIKQALPFRGRGNSPICPTNH
jgi:transposase